MIFVCSLRFMMTSRERLLAVLNGRIPDCVPVAPDFSNMIPARLTGKPFWDLYLYNDPPIYEAYIDCAKYFDIDSVMDGYFPLAFPDDNPRTGPEWERFIVKRTDDRIFVQGSYRENGHRVWNDRVEVYYRDNPPTHGVKLEKVGMPAVPKRFEPIEGVKQVDIGYEGFKRIKKHMGDQGLVGIGLTASCVFYDEESIYDYDDNPEKYEVLAQQRIVDVEKRFAKIMALEEKPDFFCVGASGSLVFQTPDVFRSIAFPAVKRAIELAHSVGIPTHVHSCGPESLLVKIFAQETNLTVIDPLEIPPMGDCNLAELKRLYGKNIILKGNLHTTDVMLRGTVDDVVRASKKAIDDAAEGGRFILSTGDQCGRDTLDANLRAMVETARTYGRY